jgi:hypothetical protein
MLELYITASKDTPSRSGLYANGLPGVTLDLLDDLTKDEQEDWEEFWGDLYSRAVTNFTGDVQGKLADKFHFDLKLIARETSLFKDDLNAESGIAGIKLEYDLPKYGRLNVVTIEVFSDAAATDAEFVFYEEDEKGRELYTKTTDLTEGWNTINIDRSFDVDELFIGYTVADVQLYQTENRRYNDCHYYEFSPLSCVFPCYNNSRGTVTQVNGGGINVIYNATCSIEKFIEDNINIFKEAFWYRIGLELFRERIMSDRFNRWTTLTVEDAEKKESVYAKECELKLNNSIRSLKLSSDPVCFLCKSTVSSTYVIP